MIEVTNYNKRQYSTPHNTYKYITKIVIKFINKRIQKNKSHFTTLS